MKNQGILKLTFIFLIASSTIFIFNACKKKEVKPSEEVKDPVKTDTIPKALYGTWQSLSGPEYWEFVQGIDSFYRLTSNYMRYKEKEHCKLGSATMTVYNTDCSFTIFMDTLTIMRKTGGLYIRFIRVDHDQINHLIWVKPVKVLKAVKLPSYFLFNSTDIYNFGIDGDTIYYMHNPYRVIKYNTVTGEYLDSFSHYTMNSICVQRPYFYYLSEGRIWKTKGFHENLEEVDSIYKSGSGVMSIDRKNNIFYVYKMPFMYAGPEGAPLQTLKGFDSRGFDVVVHYNDNDFLLSAGTFHKIRYDASTQKTSFIDSYDEVPGYRYIWPIATDGVDTWVCAENIKTGKQELVKIKLD